MRRIGMTDDGRVLVEFSHEDMTALMQVRTDAWIMVHRKEMQGPVLAPVRARCEVVPLPDAINPEKRGKRLTTEARSARRRGGQKGGPIRDKRCRKCGGGFRDETRTNCRVYCDACFDAPQRARSAASMRAHREVVKTQASGGKRSIEQVRAALRRVEKDPVERVQETAAAVAREDRGE